jgi:hypothetical protein
MVYNYVKIAAICIAAIICCAWISDALVKLGSSIEYGIKGIQVGGTSTNWSVQGTFNTGWWVFDNNNGKMCWVPSDRTNGYCLAKPYQ